MKSYNMQALRGHDYDDHQFKMDLMETSNINIPDNVLYTPQINDYVMNEIHRNNCNDLQQEINMNTGKNYTPEEARSEANVLRDESRARLNAARS